MNLLKILFLTLTLTFIEVHADTTADFINERGINQFTKSLNSQISQEFDKYFSAKVFKTLVESETKNLELKKFVLQEMNSSKPQNKKINNIVFLVNMGLGWDQSNYKNQFYYVKNFIDEIQLLGADVKFFDTYPYNPIEVNVEMIKPQLKHFLRDKNKKYILVSLCKGTPELIISLTEVLKVEPSLKKQVLGYINMSGMMGGTFFSNSRLDLNALKKLVSTWDEYAPTADTFTKYDREKTIWALPFLTDYKVHQNLESALKFKFNNIPVINISGAITDKNSLKKKSPLDPLIKYNNFAGLYPFANDGLLDIADTRLPKSMFPKQRNLVIESTHLLADGSFENYELTIKSNRIKFYKALYQALINDIEINR